MPRSRVTKIFIPNPTQDKKLSGFVHWPQHLNPLPTSTNYEELLTLHDTTPLPPRVVTLICHPHPKFGGDANNNVVFHLSNIGANGMFLQGSIPDGHNTNNIPNGEALYDYIDRMPDVEEHVELPDLDIISIKKKNNNNNNNKENISHLSTCETMALYNAQNENNTNEKNSTKSTKSISSSTSSSSSSSSSDKYVSKFFGELTSRELFGTVSPSLSDTILSNVSPSSSSSPCSGVINGSPTASKGMITVRFHFSGCRDSDGSSSWTGNTEIDDVKTILSWILSPQSNLFPTHLFIIGYSFGSCVTASALHSIFSSSASSPQVAKQNISLALFQRIFRGFCCISLPSGFFSRCLLGSHISNLRNLANILCSTQNISWFMPTIDITKPNDTNTVENAIEEKKVAKVPGLLFIQDEQDDFTSSSTLIDLVASFPNSHPSMVKILNTNSGHFWNGQEHVLATLIDHWIYQRLYSASQQSSQQTTTSSSTNNISGDNNNNNNEKNKNENGDDDSAKPLSSPPILPQLVLPNSYPVIIPNKPVKVSYKQSYCNDMNVWFPLLLVFLALGQLIYNRFEGMDGNRIVIKHNKPLTNNNNNNNDNFQGNSINGIVGLNIPGDVSHTIATTVETTNNDKNVTLDKENIKKIFTNDEL